MNNPRLMDTGALVDEVLKLQAALQRIVRESTDGEAMQIAAEALGVPFDNTEPTLRVGEEGGS